jgi:HAD superfamily hydrolase (TIGR01662 family)
MYGDAVYRGAILRALRELGASMSEAEFAAAYDECRRDQGGSFRRRLAGRFLPGASSPAFDLDAAAATVRRMASAHWAYPAEALEPDVPPCLRELERRGYRMAVVANQPSSVRDALRRDGLERYFEAWAISEELGLEKPDLRMYERVLADTGVPAQRAAMVGDRLDDDIAPAGAVGMQAVWVLRGEAPSEPTVEQLAAPDAVVRSMSELPEVLEALGPD